MTTSNAHFIASSEAHRQLSLHARKRSVQRGISEASVPLIMAYGQREFDGRGGVRYLMTDKSMAMLRRVVGVTQQVEALAGVYVVVSTDESEKVVTLGHRYH